MKTPRWRPIKTAPKDGTKILLAEPNPGGTEIPWLVIEGRWIDCPQMDDAHDSARAGREPRVSEGWYAAYVAVYSGGTMNSWCLKPIVCIRATHWMPLPAPPAMNPRSVTKPTK